MLPLVSFLVMEIFYLFWTVVKAKVTTGWICYLVWVCITKAYQWLHIYGPSEIRPQSQVAANYSKDNGIFHFEKVRSLRCAFKPAPNHNIPDFSFISVSIFNSDDIQAKGGECGSYKNLTASHVLLSYCLI